MDCLQILACVSFTGCRVCLSHGCALLCVTFFVTSLESVCDRIMQSDVAVENVIRFLNHVTGSKWKIYFWAGQVHLDVEDVVENTDTRLFCRIRFQKPLFWLFLLICPKIWFSSALCVCVSHVVLLFISVVRFYVLFSPTVILLYSLLRHLSFPKTFLVRVFLMF